MDWFYTALLPCLQTPWTGPEGNVLNHSLSSNEVTHSRTQDCVYRSQCAVVTGNSSWNPAKVRTGTFGEWNSFSHLLCQVWLYLTSGRDFVNFGFASFFEFFHFELLAGRARAVSVVRNSLWNNIALCWPEMRPSTKLHFQQRWLDEALWSQHAQWHLVVSKTYSSPSVKKIVVYPSLISRWNGRRQGIFK